MAPPNNEFSSEVIVPREVIEQDEGRGQQQQQQQQQPTKPLMDWEAPAAQGLYDPQNEHEACGVGFIVSIEGKANHKVRAPPPSLQSQAPPALRSALLKCSSV